MTGLSWHPRAYHLPGEHNQKLHGRRVRRNRGTLQELLRDDAPGTFKAPLARETSDRIVDATPWAAPDEPELKWARMMREIAEAIERGYVGDDDHVFLARGSGRISGALALQERDDEVALMRLGAVPRDYVHDPNAQGPFGIPRHAGEPSTDELPAAFAPGTGTRLMREAARYAVKTGKPVRGLALLSAVGFYEKLGMTVGEQDEYGDYPIEWTPAQAKRFLEERQWA